MIGPGHADKTSLVPDRLLPQVIILLLLFPYRPT